MNWRDKLILITGANRGIGAAFAEACAERGAHLLLAHRSPNSEQVNPLLAKGAASVKILSANLSHRQGVEDLARQVNTLPVDLLFNNAGQLTGGVLESQSLDEIYSTLQVNVNALIHLTHALLPGMLKRGSGKIVNNASVSSYMHFPCASTYSASKAAVAAFTECLRGELKGTGVSTLLLLTPGIETRMYREIPDKYSKNFDVRFLGEGLSAELYAQRICRAIEKDCGVLKPSGMEGFALSWARHWPSVFQALVSRGFRR